MSELERAWKAADTQRQQLPADYEAARTERQQHLSTDLVRERAVWVRAAARRRPAVVDEPKAGADEPQDGSDAVDRALQAAGWQYQQLSAEPEAERAKRQQQLAAGKAQEEAVVERLRAYRERWESALKVAAAQRQQLAADHEAERAEWRRQLAAGQAQERAVGEQLTASRDRLERALTAVAAHRQQLGADHEAERAEWQQQLAAVQAQHGAVVEQLGAARDRLERALTAAAAHRQQLAADHEAERAEWQRRLAAVRAQQGAIVEQLGAERDQLVSALSAAGAQQQRSADPASERVVWEQAEAARRQALVDEQQTARDALERAGRALQDYDAGTDLEKLAATIVAQSAVVLDSLPELHPRREAAASLSAAAVRAAALTRQLLANGREDRRARLTTDLNAAIGELDPVLCRLVGEEIGFSVKPASQLGPVRVDPDHVEQLLLRLAVVAREAMPAGGTVQLGTSSVEIDEAQMHEHPGVPPGQYARLTLKASGRGMDPQMQDRVSSAAAGGEDSEAAKELGLASALRALRHGGGHIAVEVEPGRELVVIGYLPTGG